MALDLAGEVALDAAHLLLDDAATQQAGAQAGHLSHHLLPGWQGGYRTPVEQLFLCGASCHPGPGVTFLPGYNSAHVVLEDLGLRAA